MGKQNSDKGVASTAKEGRADPVFSLRLAATQACWYPHLHTQGEWGAGRLRKRRDFTFPKQK